MTQQEESANHEAYKAGLARLGRAVRRGLSVDGKAALYRARRAQLQRLSDDLRGLADGVESGPCWADLEAEVEQQHQDPAAGAQQLRQLAALMRETAAAAESAVEHYKDPRTQPILPWAALVFLHLRWRHRLPPPTTYVGHEAVIEFAQLLADAKGQRDIGADRALTLLKAAAQAFDQWMPPAGSEEVFEGP